jgi:hypothetical protein
VDTNPSIQKAAALLKSGQKSRAQKILVQYLKANVESEMGWLLLAQALDQPARQRECLGYVLAINPKNDEAQRMLAALKAPPPVKPRPAPPAVSSAPEPAEPVERSVPDTAEQAVERLRGNIDRLQLGRQKQRKVLWESISTLVTIAAVAAVLAWLGLYTLLPLLGLCFLGMLAVLILILLRRREFDRAIAAQRQELAMRETLLHRR